jgi:hypothetical protein
LFPVFFLLLAALAVLSICGEIGMRVRLTRQETSRDKLAWWRRGGDEVASTYAGLFQRSYIPAFRRFAFWCFLACCVGVLIAILLKSK